jgi:hypothetical protein
MILWLSYRRFQKWSCYQYKWPHEQYFDDLEECVFAWFLFLWDPTPQSFIPLSIISILFVCVVREKYYSMRKIVKWLDWNTWMVLSEDPEKRSPSPLWARVHTGPWCPVSVALHFKVGTALGLSITVNIFKKTNSFN